MNLITQMFLPIALAAIMFSMGITLSKADFKRVFTQPKAFFVGLISQMILLPAIAFIIAWTFQMNPALSVGLMILACCPGGVTSNILTQYAKGDTALSISLTAVISMISVFTIPFVVNWNMGFFMQSITYTELPIFKTIMGVFFVTTVPVMIGMWIKANFPQWTSTMTQFISKMAAVLFFVVLTGAILKERANIIPYFIQAGWASITLCASMMIIAYKIPRLMKLSYKESVAISMECGLQNGTLAIFITMTILGNSIMMIPGAIYSLIMFPIAGVALWEFKRKAKKYATLETVHQNN